MCCADNTRMVANANLMKVFKLTIAIEDKQCLIPFCFFPVFYSDALSF